MIMVVVRGSAHQPVCLYTLNLKTRYKRTIEVLKLLEVKKSQAILEQQAIGSGFIPEHKFKGNFLDYYQEFVDNNVRKGNRHLPNSLTQFKAFIPAKVVHIFLDFTYIQ